MEREITEVYCGNGKGKTTLALGQGLRFAAQGKSVIIIQFLKGRERRELDFLEELFLPVSEYLHFPAQLLPLSFIRMFSSSAATGLVLDIFKNYGTDSYIGLVTSIMMSCTETIFYTMSVYFLAAKVTKTRYTLPGALLATLSGIIASVVIAGVISG